MTKDQFTQGVLDMEPMLYRVARTQFADHADREDAVQETLRRAWEKRDRLRDGQAFRAWMVRILLNVCRDMQRRGRRQMPMEQVPDTPAQEEAHPLLDALMTLPAHYRTVIVLHYVEGYSVAETAAILGVPQGTVKTRLARGRSALGKAYAKEALTE